MSSLFHCLFIFAIVLAMSHAFVLRSNIISKKLQLRSTPGGGQVTQDPRYQELVDRIKQDPSFNACINPEDRAVFISNAPDNLRSIDNSIKRLVGTAMHPTKGLSSIPEISETLKKIDDPIKKTLSAPKSNFMRSPQMQDESDHEKIRQEFYDQLKQEGKQIPQALNH